MILNSFIFAKSGVLLTLSLLVILACALGLAYRVHIEFYPPYFYSGACDA